VAVNTLDFNNLRLTKQRSLPSVQQRNGPQA